MMARYYRDLLVREGWIIALSVLIVLSVASIASFIAPSSYDARTTLAVEFTSPDATVLSLASKYVDTAARRATSDAILQTVAVRHRGRSAAQLAGEVSAARVGDTQLILIIVRDADAQEAISLANDIGATLVRDQATTLAQSNAKALAPIQTAIVSTQSDIDAATAALAQLQSSHAPVDQVAVAQSRLDSLRSKLAQLQDSLSRTQGFQMQHMLSMRVESVADTATPARASQLVNLSAALAFALLLGILVILVRNHFTLGVSDPQALTALTGLPVLAKVAALGAAIEAIQGTYADLARALEFLAVDRPMRTIAFVGVPSPDVDQVTAQITSDFAVFMARQRRRTLLVEANLARPSQGARFGLRGEPGLSDAIVASQTRPLPIDAVQRFMSLAASIDEPWLCVLPAGATPPDSARLLSSHAMRNVVASVTNVQADVILYDAPPATGFSGATAIASLADSVILVADMTRVRSEALVRAKQLLTASGAVILGVVVWSGAAPAAPQVIANRAPDNASSRGAASGISLGARIGVRE